MEHALPSAVPVETFHLLHEEETSPSEMVTDKGYHKLEIFVCAVMKSELSGTYLKLEPV